MSELPNTPRIGESETSAFKQSPEYQHYFGDIARQASINGVMAYIEQSSMHDRDVATAWLLDDVKALDRLLDKKHRQAKLHGALMRTSTEMWAHVFMQRYREQRPRRLQGLQQSEIPVV